MLILAAFILGLASATAIGISISGSLSARIKELEIQLKQTLEREHVLRGQLDETRKKGSQ